MEKMDMKTAVEYCMRDNRASIYTPTQAIYDKLGSYLKMLGIQWIDDLTGGNRFSVYKDRTMVSLSKDNKAMLGDFSDYGNKDSIMIEIDSSDFVVIDNIYYTNKTDAIIAINSVFSHEVI